MTQVIDQSPLGAPAETDPAAALRRVLAASPEPLTLSKIRAALPPPQRRMSLEELAETLRRQVAANVLYQYPRYRSQQDRYWDRPMAVHVAALLHQALEQGALPWSELRRKLPAYAHPQAEEVLQQQLAQGTLYRYPRAGRGGERFGVRPPDPKDFLRTELSGVFERLEKLGFNQAALREAAIELLHDEEWSSASRSESEPSPEIGALAEQQAETHPEAPDAVSQM